MLDLIMDKTRELYDQGYQKEVLTVDNHADGPYLWMRLQKKIRNGLKKFSNFCNSTKATAQDGVSPAFLGTAKSAPTNFGATMFLEMFLKDLSPKFGSIPILNFYTSSKINVPM